MKIAFPNFSNTKSLFVPKIDIFILNVPEISARLLLNWCCESLLATHCIFFFFKSNCVCILYMTMQFIILNVINVSAIFVIVFIMRRYEIRWLIELVKRFILLYIMNGTATTSEMYFYHICHRWTTEKWCNFNIRNLIYSILFTSDQWKYINSYRWIASNPNDLNS